MAQTTTIMRESPDYFVARLDNNGIRVGAKGMFAIDLPESHNIFRAAMNLGEDQSHQVAWDGHIEGFLDAQIEGGFIPLDAIR